ncbi:hypothetical protein K4K49_011745 [Colletotrichum sp. SAR 10_70]|nr:hypothetical protein K4K50_011974 [Colletotrichum sp. SAR 10_71]KAI8150906.1 hypothetical protein K4K49_011745 [Colletotrichum sp. SAR 10_70]KAI8210826.1 hypothetical protein K4K53_012191 [Colletotrichum sp. SAR 10_77]
MPTRSQASPTLNIQAEARLLQEKVESSILNVEDFSNEVVRLAKKYKTTHTLAEIVAFFPAKTQDFLFRLLKIPHNNLPSLFDESSSVRFYIELKDRAACYPLDKVIDALIEARNKRKAGLAGAGISKTKIWAPSDVKAAEEILQRNQKSTPVDTKLLVGDIPDIKSSEGDSGAMREKETLIENVRHTAMKLESEQQIEEGEKQVEEDDHQVDEGDHQVEEDDHITSSVTPHNCTKLDDEHDSYMETAVPPIEIKMDSSEVSESQVDVPQMAPDTRSFASLAPDTELTGATMVTCLQTLLGAVASSKWSMIPSDFDVAGVGVYEEDVEGAEKVLVPLHIKNPYHWVLLAIRPDPPEVEVFDSLSDVSSWKNKIEASVGELCRRHLGKFLGSRVPTVVYRQSLQQVRDKDCGIFTLINAAYLIAGRRNPVHTDPNVWRKTLASFDYGSALDADDAPWRLHPELDMAGYDEKEDMFYARKGQRVTDDDWSASKASRKAYEDHVDKMLMESRTRNLRKLENHHKDVHEVLTVLHDILSTTTPAQREKESEKLSKEYSARAATLSSLEDIPNPTIDDRLYREKVKARRRALLKRLKSVQMSGPALKAAERRLQLELKDVVERQQKVKERGVEAET